MLILETGQLPEQPRRNNHFTLWNKNKWERSIKSINTAKVMQSQGEGDLMCLRHLMRWRNEQLLRLFAELKGSRQPSVVVSEGTIPLFSDPLPKGWGGQTEAVTFWIICFKAQSSVLGLLWVSFAPNPPTLSTGQVTLGKSHQFSQSSCYPWESVTLGFSQRSSFRWGGISQKLTIPSSCAVCEHVIMLQY